jgi:DNA replication protein DnaC
MFALRNRTLPDHLAEYLYDHNPGLGRSYKTYCPTCLKTGTYRWRGEDVVCDCQLQLALHKFYLDAGIGLEYQRLSWDDWEGAPGVREICARYVETGMYKRGLGLLFRGDFGVGKTMAANLLLKDLVKEGVSCYALTFATMIERHTAGWRDDEEREYFNTKVRDCQVLLLDDVGKSMRASAAARNFHESTFDDVLRPRTQSGKATLITTNMTEAEMGVGYGAGVLSLLSGHALDYDFPDAEDYRPTAKSRTATEALSGEVRPIF